MVDPDAETNVDEYVLVLDGIAHAVTLADDTRTVPEVYTRATIPTVTRAAGDAVSMHSRRPVGALLAACLDAARLAGAETVTLAPRGAVVLDAARIEALAAALDRALERFDTAPDARRVAAACAALRDVLRQSLQEQPPSKE